MRASRSPRTRLTQAMSRKTTLAEPPFCMFAATGAFARTASRAGALCTSVPFLVLDCLLPGIGGCQSMVIVRLVWWYVGFWRG